MVVLTPCWIQKIAMILVQAGNKVVKATGGLITLANNNSASFESCNFGTIIPGRATRLTIFALGKVPVTFNVHNERLTSAQFLYLEPNSCGCCRRQGIPP